MTEIRGNFSAKSLLSAFGNDKKDESSGKLNPEYSDFMFVDGKIIKIDKSDEVLPGDKITKLKAKYKQTSQLPNYAVKGLKGDKNANFFEFLQLGKIPYWVGGGMLAWCFAAGGPKSKPLTKEKAVGIGLYYLAAASAKALIDGPVKFFKGIDLNRKYKDIIALKTESKDGHSDKKTEYHNVYESIDFTRWDLLYKEDSQAAKDPDHVNSEYDKLAQSMGLNKDLNDPDSTVKPYVKKIIVASRASKSALIIPLAALAAGLSKYEGWKTWGESLGKDFKEVFKRKSGITSKFSKMMTTAGGLAHIANNHLVKPLKESFVHLWNGNSLNGNKFMGKAAILAPIAAVVLANLNILRIAYLKQDKYIDSSHPEGASTLKNKSTPIALGGSPLSNNGSTDEYTF